MEKGYERPVVMGVMHSETTSSTDQLEVRVAQTDDGEIVGQPVLSKTETTNVDVTTLPKVNTTASVCVGCTDQSKEVTPTYSSDYYLSEFEFDMAPELSLDISKPQLTRNDVEIPFTTLLKKNDQILETLVLS